MHIGCISDRRDGESLQMDKPVTVKGGLSHGLGAPLQSQSQRFVRPMTRRCLQSLREIGICCNTYDVRSVSVRQLLHLAVAGSAAAFCKSVW